MEQQYFLSLDSEELQHQCGEATTHEDGSHYDDESGGEDELSRLALRVPDGEREGNGAAQTREYQHVLEAVLYAFGSTQIEEEG